MLVLLVHPGGPFWKNKDAGAWSIPKGEYDDAEEPLAAAKREFAEELGALPAGEVTPLGEIRQKAGKVVTAFALARRVRLRHLPMQFIRDRMAAEERQARELSRDRSGAVVLAGRSAAQDQPGAGRIDRPARGCACYFFSREIPPGPTLSCTPLGAARLRSASSARLWPCA